MSVLVLLYGVWYFGSLGVLAFCFLGMLSVGQ